METEAAAVMLSGSPDHHSACSTKYSCLCYTSRAPATASPPSSHLPVTPSVPVRHNLEKETARKLRDIHEHYSNILQ